MKSVVLVVDDDPIILFSLVELLEAEGFFVFAADSAEKGFEIFSRENIKIVFTDLEMPGDNGDFLCRQIKKNKPDTWVCAITGNPEAFKEARDINAQFDDYLPKPFNFELIVKTIKRVSEQKMKK